jgi:hypothetical protein
MKYLKEMKVKEARRSGFNDYISIKIEPKGNIPLAKMITLGSMNHFFSGIGRGTAFVRQGLSATPLIFLPRTVPAAVNGKIMNRQIAVTLS